MMMIRRAFSGTEAAENCEVLKRGSLYFLQKIQVANNGNTKLRWLRKEHRYPDMEMTRSRSQTRR